MGNYYLARVLSEMGKYTEAEQNYQKALAVKPTFEAALIELGFLYEKQKKS